MFEFFYLPELNKNIITKLVKVINYNLIEEAKQKGKGAVLVGGHFSNWELMAFSFSEVTDNKLNVITKIQASKGLNEKINEYRELRGNEMIEIGFSLKKIFEKLRKNELIGFLIDQSAHPDYSSYINLFGRKVASFSGPAKIALRQRPELILGFILRDTSNNYKLEFKKIFYDDLKENSDENVVELTQRIQSEFETVIRNNPGQWLWFHKRFKHMKS